VDQAYSNFGLLSVRRCTTAGPDEYTDLTMKFDRQEVVAALEEEDGDCVLLTLTGSLKDDFGGIDIEGVDIVKIIKKGKNGNGNGGGRGR